MKFCPNCGASLTGGAASFCSECGFALKMAAEPQPVQAKEVGPVQDDTHQAKVVHQTSAPEDAASYDATDEKRTWKRKPKKSPKVRPPRKLRPEAKEHIQPDPPEEPQIPINDGYDGYYDDIRALDEGQRQAEKLDPDMIKKIGLIAGGALLFVIIAIVALLLM